MLKLNCLMQGSERLMTKVTVCIIHEGVYYTQKHVVYISVLTFVT